MTDDDKLHHIHSKLDDLHSDLKDHIVKEEETFDKIHGRLEIVEEDNKELKTMWKFIKGIAIFIGAVLTIFWVDIKNIFGK